MIQTRLNPLERMPCAGRTGASDCPERAVRCDPRPRSAPLSPPCGVQDASFHKESAVRARLRLYLRKVWLVLCLSPSLSQCSEHGFSGSTDVLCRRHPSSVTVASDLGSGSFFRSVKKSPSYLRLNLLSKAWLETAADPGLIRQRK